MGTKLSLNFCEILVEEAHAHCQKLDHFGCEKGFLFHQDTSS